MKEIEFDLLTEPWIRVRLKDNTVQEVSLTEALVSAQDYVDLAGEMPTQDAAVLRLLLAVLFTVFSRVNVKGEPEPLEKRGQALRRWIELWQLGHFPAEPIRDYLEQWKDRFWLFHPTHPFLAGAGSKNRHGVWGGQAQRRNVGKQQ
ncbi:MAG: type I-E CRISPR-associated protein Cse1/CasA [Faecalibacterium prausnitzii]